MPQPWEAPAHDGFVLTGEWTWRPFNLSAARERKPTKLREGEHLYMEYSGGDMTPEEHEMTHKLCALEDKYRD